jgi:eukaryotic-like serine/threonine-protein kinase
MLRSTAVTTSFGRYELLQPLDRGGMGDVYVARTRGPERVQKTVVVKRIRAERAGDETARARFAEEARVAVSLVHPHIVPVFEFGELDGEYFLVMEWLRGGSLSRIAGIDRPPLPWSAVALVGSQVCDALNYVHGRDNGRGAHLVHGDLTPRNILLSSDGHALLSDFGLARFAGHGMGGTARYLAPEQARGESFDARADLYALALVLAEAATGRPAYDRELERARQQARVGVVPELDGCHAGVAAVLRRALAPRPDGRYADAAAMRAAFDALLDGEPGARAEGRKTLLVRVAAAAESDVPTPGIGSRGSRSIATKDATQATASRRRRIAFALIALAFGAGAATLLAHEGSRRRHQDHHDHAARFEQPPPPPPSPSAPSSGVAATATPSPDVAPRPAPTATLRSTAARSLAGDKPRAEHKANVEASAELDLNATPWAHVRVDGVNVGETPLLGLKLRAGEHVVELVNEPLAVRRQQTIALKPGEHARRLFDLSSPQQ